MPIADSDVEITDTDPNTVTMNSATITLTNPAAGDKLNVSGLPAGIVSTGNGSSIIQLSGVASIADYQAAVEAVTFANDALQVSGADRVIEVQVFNGDVLSPIATTIDVFGTPTVNTITTTDSQPQITGTLDGDTFTASAGSGGDLTVTVNGITYSESDPELTVSGNTWTLSLTNAQTLPTGIYNVTVVQTDGTNQVTDQSTNEVRVIDAPEWSVTGDASVQEGDDADFTVSLIGTISCGQLKQA